MKKRATAYQKLQQENKQSLKSGKLMADSAQDVCSTGPIDLRIDKRPFSPIENKQTLVT